MVTVTGFQKRENENGSNFHVLTLQGGVEMIKSHKTGKYYATARKANLVTTFDEETCKAMVGQKLPGSIEKQECDPYEYTIPNSGEKVMLTHTYAYNPENAPVEEQVFG